MAKLQVTLRGITPLLMHNPMGSMTQTGAKTPAQRIPKPEDEAERATYQDEEGNLVFPMAAIPSAILYAAIGYKIGRRGAKSVLAGALLNFTSLDGDVEWLPLTDHNGVPQTEYEIDIRRVVIQRSAILRARPKLKEWQTELIITFDEQFVDRETVLLTLKRAGVVAGLGDFRPQRGGLFGRFEVIET